MPIDEQYDIGHGVKIKWDPDGKGLYWQHAECRTWTALRFVPDPRSTGHQLMRGDFTNTAGLTIVGKLTCPRNCGKQGFVKEGRWVPI